MVKRATVQRKALAKGIDEVRLGPDRTKGARNDAMGAERERGNRSVLRGAFSTKPADPESFPK